MNLEIWGIWITALSFILFAIVFTAFEAFDRLSGGQVMKLEETEPELAERLGRWLEQSDSIRAVFKLLLFILAAVLGMFTMLLVQRWTGRIQQEWQVPFIIGAIILYWSFGEIFALLLLYRSDLWVLKIVIPATLLLANTVLLPFTLLSRKLRENAEDWRDEEAPEQIVSAEDEILSLVENYGDHENADADLEEDEKRMIKGILDLDDMSVRTIMTPRVDIEAIPASASIAEAKQKFISTGHSRIPIYGRSVDEIKGIIYAKDFIDDKRIAGKSLDQLAHKPLFIPESKGVGDLLEEIRRLHNHFAVIIDEYGGTSGIVTFEDIIEEIVGDVQDEYDNEESDRRAPSKQPDGSIILMARTPISEVNELLDADIPETEGADTIGGYICAELGRIPEDGEQFHFDDAGLTATVLKADKRKILKLKLELKKGESDEN